jgi:hypothetical protein
VSVLEFFGLVVLTAWIVLPTLLVTAFAVDWLLHVRKRRLSRADGGPGGARGLVQEHPDHFKVDAEIGHPEAHEIPIDPVSRRRPDDPRRE